FTVPLLKLSSTAFAMMLGTYPPSTIPKPLSTFAANCDGHVAYRDWNLLFGTLLDAERELIALIELNSPSAFCCRGAARGISPDLLLNRPIRRGSSRGHMADDSLRENF